MIHKRTFSNTSIDSFNFNNNKLENYPREPTIDEANFEEISIRSKRHYSQLSVKQQLPATPSPLQRQITRTSIHSNASMNTVVQQQQQQQQQQLKRTSMMTPSQYIINVNRTPGNLTPSQRLNLRKSNITSSISQYKFDDTNIAKHKPQQAIDDRDEVIDDNVLFNVPFSQPMSSLTQREKFLFDNQSRNLSFVTDDSTRTSSIISHVSINDSVSSVEEDERDDILAGRDLTTANVKQHTRNQSSVIITDKEFNSISKDAQELTVLCNKDEFSQIYDESFQKRRMLSNFKRILSILPNKMTGNTTAKSVDPKYHTFTRPIWLPPKSSYEKLKHQKESENILYNALYQESQLQQKRLIELDQAIKQRQQDVKTWERSLLNVKTFQDLSFKDITALYWRGISADIRSNVWWKINLLKKPKEFDETFCEFYFDKFLIIQSKLFHLNRNSTTTKNEEQIQALLNSKVFDVPLLQWYKLYNQVYKDLMLNVYPDLNYFQDTEVIAKITKVIFSNILYFIDQQGLPLDGSDITKYYLPGMINLAAIFHYNYKNTYKSFVSMCQFYRLRLPSMMLGYINGPKEMQPILKNSLNSYMVYKFEKILKTKLNRILVHFKIHNVSSYDYLPQLMLSLGLNLFNFEISQRIVDIVLFDSNPDEVIVNLIVNYMMKIQHKLFGNKLEILDALFGKNLIRSDSNTQKYVNVGYEIEFIDSLKELCK
ncbi:TBC domain-containing protein C23D3.03c [Candida viswanathii]|uniref:Oxidant-induced cell-cycle arrest protein 5 n=1 Tax=Candida viswanathii TaxID=5486 RepID=A0A367YIU9_9ASCO|nr:TBC domain-containing protein C23D3.03c [Candida viswanathii]